MAVFKIIIIWLLLKRFCTKTIHFKKTLSRRLCLFSCHNLLKLAPPVFVFVFVFVFLYLYCILYLFSCHNPLKLASPPPRLKLVTRKTNFAQPPPASNIHIGGKNYFNFHTGGTKVNIAIEIIQQGYLRWKFTESCHCYLEGWRCSVKYSRRQKLGWFEV